MYCKECGNPMNEGANFCLHCGAKRADLAVEPVEKAAIENTVERTTKQVQYSSGNYASTQEEGVTIPDIDPRLFDLDQGYMDLADQGPEKKIDLGAGLDFGAPRPTTDTAYPPIAAPTPIEGAGQPPKFEAPIFPQAPYTIGGDAQPKVIGTYLSDSVPEGFMLDNSSGLYFKSVEKMDPATSLMAEEVTYYNTTTKEVSVVVYPKVPAPPIMGYSVHSTPAQDASRNKSNRGIVIVIAILAAALVLAVVAGIIALSGSRSSNSRKDVKDSARTSSSVLESWRRRESSEEYAYDYESSEESEVSFFEYSEEYSEEYPDKTENPRRTADIYKAYWPIAAEETKYFFDSGFQGNFKKRIGFDGEAYYYFLNYVTGEDYAADNEKGSERYLYRMKVGSDIPELFLDVGEDKSIYSYEVFEDVVYIAIVEDYQEDDETYADYFVYDILYEEISYLFTLPACRLIGSGGYVYVNDYEINQLVVIGRDIDDNFAYDILPYEVPSGTYQVYSSTSVNDGKLLLCVVNPKSEFVYYSYNILTGETEELLVIGEEYLPYNVYIFGDTAVYSRHIYGTDPETSTIVVVNDGVETVVSEVPYDKESYYGNFVLFDGGVFSYNKDNQIICAAYNGKTLVEIYALEGMKETYGMAGGMLLAGKGMLELATEEITVLKDPIKSDYLMESSLFDESVTDYIYIY